MADIVGSSNRKGKSLMNDFKVAVAWANKMDKRQIVSPLTITLGDEFQGVVKNAHSALQIVFDLEQYLMRLKNPFKIRYVIHEGEIETQLNRKNAHEMLGPGLTHARRVLVALKSSRHRFNVSLKDKEVSEKLMLGMLIYQGIVDRWTVAQQRVVSAFWEQLSDYRKVAKKLKKDPTVMWRRKRSLMIERRLFLKENISVSYARSCFRLLICSGLITWN